MKGLDTLLAIMSSVAMSTNTKQNIHEWLKTLSPNAVISNVTVSVSHPDDICIEVQETTRHQNFKNYTLSTISEIQTNYNKSYFTNYSDTLNSAVENLNTVISHDETLQSIKKIIDHPSITDTAKIKVLHWIISTHYTHMEEGLSLIVNKITPSAKRINRINDVITLVEYSVLVSLLLYQIGTVIAPTKLQNTFRIVETRYNK